MAELRAVIEQRTAELCSMATQVEDLEAKNGKQLAALRLNRRPYFVFLVGGPTL